MTTNDQPTNDRPTYETTTPNGSPIVPRGTRVIIREPYRIRAYPERGTLIGQVGITDSDPDDDGDIRVVRPDGQDQWPGYEGRYCYISKWDLAPEDAPENAPEDAPEDARQRIVGVEYEPVAGDYVRVTDVADGATPEFREHALGRIATYNRRNAAMHEVRFFTPFLGDLTWAVAGVTALTANTARTRDEKFPFGVGANPAPGVKCTAVCSNGAWVCSRPAGHTGQHVAAINHAGEVVRTWPGTTTSTTTGSPTSEPATDDGEQQDAQQQDAEQLARQQYTALANAAVSLAADERWCTEFEDVMDGAGFGEVHCNRTQSYSLLIEFDYDLDADVLRDAVATLMGKDPDEGSMRIDNDERVTGEVWIDWTGNNPDDLDTGELNTILSDAGYTDTCGERLRDHETHDYDDTYETPDVDTQLGQHPTWAARLAAFQDLIATEARGRVWHHHLAALYQHAGVPRPRTATLTVATTATRKVSHYTGDVYGDLLVSQRQAKGIDATPDHITLTKAIEYTIDNPYPDAECHCDERVENHKGEKTLLPDTLIQPVIVGAKERLIELFGTTDGWTAQHADTTITCDYCD